MDPRFPDRIRNINARKVVITFSILLLLFAIAIGYGIGFIIVSASATSSQTRLNEIESESRDIQVRLTEIESENIESRLDNITIRLVAFEDALTSDNTTEFGQFWAIDTRLDDLEADTGVVTGSYGSSTTVPTFTVSENGRITIANDVPIDCIRSINTIGPFAYDFEINGDADIGVVAGANSISLRLLNTGVTPGTYGSSSLVPVVTVDANGRIASVTTAAIAPEGFQSINLISAAPVTYNFNITGSNDINITPGTHELFFDLTDTGVTPGSYGSLSAINTFAVDYKGRLTTASSVSATSAATASTYATRDSNAASAFGSLILGGTSQQSLQFVADTSPSAGIAFGSDTSPTANLYRAGLGRLQTDGLLKVAPTINQLVPFADPPSSYMGAFVCDPAWNSTIFNGKSLISAYITNNFNNSLPGTNAVDTVVVNDGGIGYVVGDLLIVSGGNANSQIQVTSVDVISGGILTVIITRGGSGYSASNGITTTGGSGFNATVNTTVLTTAYSTVTGLAVYAIGGNTGYSTASIGNLFELEIKTSNFGNGPITITGQHIGIRINSLTAPCTTAFGITIANVFGGTSTNIGIDVASISGTGVTNAGIALRRSAGATNNYALWLSDTSGLTSGGITWGQDTQPVPNLYRIAANTLRTDSIFHGKTFRIASTSTTAITGSVQWNQTTGTTALGVGVLGTNNLNGLQLSTNGVSTFIINNGGTGYNVNDLLIISGGSGTAQVKVTGVSSGVILTMVLTRPGSGYSVTSGISLTGGAGSNATLDILTINTTPFTTVVGVQGQGFDATSGFVTPTVTTAIGFQTLAPVLGSGPVVVTNIIGIDVPAHAIATTNSYALRIAAPTGGTSINAALNFVSNTIAAGGITFGADATPSTNLYRSATNIIKSDADITARHHYTSSAGIPTAVAGTGAGTSPTITVTTGSTDCKMQITVLTGTLPTAAGIIITVTYNSAFINTLNKGVIFSVAGANAALLSGVTQPYISSEALGTFVLTAGPTALTAATSYVWNFQTCT